MFSLLNYLFAACMLSVLVVAMASSPQPAGVLEGHLKIVSPKEVELAEASPSKEKNENFTDYTLIILSKAEQKEVTRITADQSGNYRVSLPPGDYILDVSGRKPKGHLRAKPQPFTVAANRTVRVDMDIDTGVR